MYLDPLLAKDKHFHSYVEHHETRPFDDIILYLKWLTCGSCMTFSHVPNHVMRQSGYMQYIPNDPFVFVLLAMTHRDMDIMFDDYLNHLVLGEKCSIMAESD